MAPAKSTSSEAAGQDIVNQYLEGIAAVKAVLSNPEASKDEKKAARQSLNDLTIMLGRFHTGNVEGRSALLLGLIHELREVTDRIQPNSPIAGVLDKITKVAGTATELLAKERAG